MWKTDKNKRATHVDKTGKVCAIVQQLIDSGANYLRHRQNADNIAVVLPKI